jgi:hypothetical protein
MHRSATYREIQKWVKQQFKYVPATCWIAHCKEIYGLPLGDSHNREGAKRAKPCPAEKQPDIKKAFQHFGLLS